MRMEMGLEVVGCLGRNEDGQCDCTRMQGEEYFDGEM